MEERIKALETELENLKTEWRESQKVEFTPGEKVMCNGREVVFLMPAEYSPATGEKYVTPNACLVYRPSCGVSCHGVTDVMVISRAQIKKI